MCEREDASEVATHGRPDDVNLLCAQRVDETCKPLDTEAPKTYGSDRYGVAEATAWPVRNQQPPTQLAGDQRPFPSVVQHAVYEHHRPLAVTTDNGRGSVAVRVAEPGRRRFEAVRLEQFEPTVLKRKTARVTIHFRCPLYRSAPCQSRTPGREHTHLARSGATPLVDSAAQNTDVEVVIGAPIAGDLCA